jgi:hypothetical protein
MAQQIKKKFIGNDQIDSTKLKLLQNQAVRAVDSTGTERELIKLGATDEVLVKGQEVGLKSEIEAEESRAMAEESSIRALISGNSTDQSQLVDEEESRAMAAEASIVTSLNQEISARQADVDSEESRAMLAESSLQTQITDHESRLDVLEQDPTTKEYVDGEVSGLQDQIDNVLSNLDPAALDSLTEIVSAFQSADSDLQGTISTLAANSSDAIDEEESRAMAAESSLQSAITAEQSRAMLAEASVQSNVNNAVSAVTTSLNSLQSQIIYSDSRLTQEISDRASDVNVEESRAMAAESSLQSAITAEQSRAQVEESTLQAHIDSEESRAMGIESSIQSSFDSHVEEVESRLSSLEANPTTEAYVDGEISSVQSAIAAEQSRAQLAESSLQSDIDGEESRAMSAESSLQVQFSSSISSEQSRAQSVESTLQANIDSEESRAEFAESQLQVAIDDEESRAMAAESSLQSGIDSEESRAEAAESSLQMQLTDHESRLDVLESDPVTKMYVDGEVSDLQGQIDNVLTNIDSAALDSLTEIVSAFQAADNTLQGTISTLAGNSSGNIQAEQSRAMVAEASIVTSLNQEISARQADVDSEESRAMSAESSLQSDIESEESRAMAAESSLQSELNDLDGYAQDIRSDLDSEESRAMAAESSLQSQFSSSISSEQSRAVAAEASVQSNITNAVSAVTVSLNSLQSQITYSDSRLTQEISNRTSDVNAEESRAMAAESTLQAGIDSEESRAIASEESLAVRISSLESVSFNKESFLVGSNGVGTSHVDLAHEVDDMSLVVFVGRLALHKDEDFTVSVVSDVTRITFTGSFASGGDEAVANGDKIFVTYSFVDAGNDEGGGGSGGGGGVNPNAMTWHNVDPIHYTTGSNGYISKNFPGNSPSVTNEVGFNGPFEITYTFNGFSFGNNEGNPSLIGFSNSSQSSWRYGSGQFISLNGTNSPKLGNGSDQGSSITAYGFSPLSSGLNTVTFKMTSGGQVSVVINGLELSIGSYAAGTTYWAGTRLTDAGAIIESTSLVVG